ncbi:MAG: S8 family serine peptidase [Oscillospiraceae bacterium]
MRRDGTLYVSAAQAVGVTGVAPDAQLITMKVFGKKGGAYSSDYMAAVEDAVVLGCDTVNLSLGAPYPGFVTAHEDAEEGSAFVDRIMEELSETGIIMCVAATVTTATGPTRTRPSASCTPMRPVPTRVSSPSTYENALSVASVDNVGFVSEYESLFISASGDAFEPAVEKTPNGVQREWKSLDEAGEGTTYEVVFLGDPSTSLQARPRPTSGSTPLLPRTLQASTSPARWS